MELLIFMRHKSPTRDDGKSAESERRPVCIWENQGWSQLNIIFGGNLYVDIYILFYITAGCICICILFLFISFRDSHASDRFTYNSVREAGATPKRVIG